jgi:hypothetical protein
MQAGTCQLPTWLSSWFAKAKSQLQSEPSAFAMAAAFKTLQGRKAA